MDNDDYVPMHTSPEPRAHYQVDTFPRCVTPDSRSLMDTKKGKAQKQKLSLWKKGKKKLTKWSSKESLDGKKGLDDDTNSVSGLSLPGQELDYVDMKKYGNSGPGNVLHRRDPDTKSVDSLVVDQSQSLYNTPRSHINRALPTPPEQDDNCYLSIQGQGLQHSYEETIIKPKPSSDTKSLASSTSFSTDEGIFQLLKEREKYKSISESFPLIELLENSTLPQFLRVTRGFYTDDEDESLSDGDLLVAYCVKTRDSVATQNPSGTKFSIPLNSHLKFVISPPNVSRVSELLKSQSTHYKTIADIAALPNTPRIVRTMQDYKGKSDHESIAAGTLLFLEAIAKQENSIFVAAKDLSGKEYGLREDCCAGFSTAIGDTWLFLSEIVEHITFPAQVFVITNEMIMSTSVEDAEANALTTWPLTLIKTERGKYLVASSDITGDHDYNQDYILEIPLHLDVEVECVTHPEKDHTEALKMASRAIYDQIKMKPGHLVSQETMAGNDRELQEELYGSVCEMEYLRQIRLDKSLELKNPPNCRNKEGNLVPTMRKSQSGGHVGTRQPVPLPRTGKRNSFVDLTSHNVLQPVAEEQKKLHLLRSNRPLPPTPTSAKPEEQLSNGIDDTYNVPNSLPALTDVLVPATEGEEQDLYMNQTSAQTSTQIHIQKSRTLVRGSVPSIDVQRKYKSWEARRKSDPAHVFHRVQPSSTDVVASGVTDQSKPENTAVSTTVTTDPHILDLRQKMVVLENRMSHLLPGAHQNTPSGPGAYRELEKELARIRTRQVRLEARVAEYDEEIKALTAKLQHLTTTVAPDESTVANLQELRVLNVQQVGKLLAAMRLESYQGDFVRRRIDGSVLSFLTPESLDEMKVTKVDQAQLMTVIRGLKSPLKLMKEEINC